MNATEIQGSTILIVDDNPMNLSVLFEYLHEKQFKVLTVQRGEHAVKQAQENPPDLILLDVIMPGIDGFETCRRLKQNEATQEIPVIFMTALSDTADKVKGFDAGGLDYITKPIQLEEALARITTHLTLRNLQQRLQEKNAQLQQEITECKRIEETLREREERLRRQHGVLSKIAESKIFLGTDLDAALRQITETAAQGLGVKRVGVWLYSNDRSRIRCIDLYDDEAYRHSKNIELAAADYPTYFKSLESNKIIAANDAHTDPRTAEFSDSYLSSLGISSMLDVPIWVDGKVVGVVCQEHVGPQRCWSIEEKTFARSIANFVALAIGTSKRKQAEEELRILSRAIEQSPVTVVITDARGNIQYVNPKFVELTGYSPEEILGQNTRILNAGKQPPQLYKELWETITSGHEWHGELCNKKKNGEMYWEQASISPVRNAQGETTHFVAVKEDITERRRTAEELRRAKEVAEQANRTKSDFLSNMSHEIRTPMNAIIGMTHLALKTELSPKQTDYLNKIHSSAHALLGIINDILDLSKIEAGKLDIEMVDFQLEEVLNNLANLVAMQAHEKGLEFLIHTSPDVPQNLIGDPLRLRQVLVNLVNNAVKFTDFGEIVMVTELVKTEPERVMLKFSVRDTGIGLTQGQISNLFQAFGQADTSTTRKYGGTGLGLSISKRLVNMMGGDIWVESQPGQGSTFTFTVVFGRQHEAEEKHLVPSPDLRGMRVLVVDDNATSQKILQEILESFTFRVSKASSAEEGLAKLEQAAKEEPYDLVLMDWNMPGMDGIQASQRIKHRPELSRTSIILITAYGREDVMHRAEQTGLDGVLIKPVNQSVLFNTIMQIFDKDASKEPQILREYISEEKALNNIRGARILVAEDNDINQQVARELLEGAGLVVIVANDGKEAVSAVKGQKFDAVLMDIQMPEMDGYEATRQIRELETRNPEDQPSSIQHPASIPIIAMTAHAMAGDREKSLDAGMNDHVTKPLKPDQLFSTLIKWIAPGERELAAQLAARSDEDNAAQEPLLLSDLPGISVQSGLARVSGNTKLYRTLLTRFSRDYSDITKQIKRALDEGKQELARRLVHTVKGVAGNIGAHELYTAASAWEAAIKHGSPKEIVERANHFTEALKRVLDSLQSMLADQADADARHVSSVVANPETLLAVLLKLEPCVRKRQPKMCAPVIQEIAGISWPDVYAQDAATLVQLIRKYKFQDAQAILESMINTLQEEGETYA